jgi:hypothetical protein
MPEPHADYVWAGTYAPQVAALLADLEQVPLTAIHMEFSEVYACGVPNPHHFGRAEIGGDDA